MTLPQMLRPLKWGGQKKYSSIQPCVKWEDNCDFAHPIVICSLHPVSNWIITESSNFPWSDVEFLDIFTDANAKIRTALPGEYQK